MTSLMIEQIEIPASSRQWRAMTAARERLADVLAGRTVWCAAIPSCAGAADELRACLDGAAPGMSADRLEVQSGAQMSRLAAAVDGMLAAGSSARALGAADEEALFADAVVDGDALLGDAVGAGDVVVAHDGVSALVARAARERGAHVVWRVRVSQESSHGTRQARDLLRSFTVGVDAYVLQWLERGTRGEVIEGVAAAMPSSDAVAVTRTPGPGGDEELRYLAWRMAYAEIVRDDRQEHVGGTLHTRPAVAAR